MNINRDSILNRTHYGIKIYSHVLRHYYPGETVLSLSGRDCQPTKNPFNNNMPTLKVQIVNNCAEHFDLLNAMDKGDAFDFAAMHYNLKGEELFKKLDEELNLRIEERTDCPTEIVVAPAPPPLQQIIIPAFSYFEAPVSNTFPKEEINLLQVYQRIKGDDFAEHTNALRAIADKTEARKYKATHFDYVTFSGTFSKRNDKSLLRHSGLITVDFDHIANVEELKEQLLQDEYFETELLFISPSGDGIKWVVAVDITSATHLNYFKAIANYIKATYQLEVDQSGKDLSRACFLAQDAGAFINPKYLKS
jgi:hypothetical protein